MRRLLIALTVLALGACGAGGGDNDGKGVASLGDATKTANDQAAPDKKDGEKDREKAMLDFAACMREHGIEMADPDMDGKGGMVRVRPGTAVGDAVEGPPDEGKMSAADEACRHHIEGLAGGRGPMDDPAMQDKMVKFAQCMREQGIDMPDPSGEGGRVAIRVQEEDRDKLEAAHKACESVAPFKAGGSVEPAK